MRKLRQTALMTALLIGIASTSGCAQKRQTVVKAKPVKPTLEVVVERDSMVCFGKPDAVKLGLYTLELERNY